MFTGIPAGARPGGRVTVWVLRLLGAAGLGAAVVAWARASDSVVVSEQVDWAAVALAGTAAVILGLLLSVLTARQAVSLRLAGLARVLSGTDVAFEAPAAPAPARNGVATEVDSFVAAARMARYHRAGCPLAAGKAVRPAGLADHERAGRRPCGVCCR